MNRFKFAVPMATLIAAGLLQTAARAESFDVTATHVVTHRGAATALAPGDNDIDKVDRLKCTSDAGCSVVIETRFMVTEPADLRICTLVDGIEASPPCGVDSDAPYVQNTFQGVAALPKGVHTIHTVVNADANRSLEGYQIVYTLYQHQ